MTKFTVEVEVKFEKQVEEAEFRAMVERLKLQLVIADLYRVIGTLTSLILWMDVPGDEIDHPNVDDWARELGKI